MAISARIAYLNKHRRRGDVKCISTQLSLSISTVYDIVTGKFEGEYCEKVLASLESIIELRIASEKKLASHYGKKLNKK